MSIKLAKKIGFCFGVKRAVTMAEDALKKNNPIYSLGSIIHNKDVVRELSKKGLKVVGDIDDVKGGIVVISSHGLSPKVARAIHGKGIKIIDTTCPFVLNAQRIAKRLNDEGYRVIIVGDKDHPEVRALVDFAPRSACVIKNKSEARRLKFKPNKKVSIISQTTQSTANFQDVAETILAKRPKELRIFNTICQDAEERQALAERLAGEVDLMLVVGGKDSANTRRLNDVCRRVSRSSRHIETEADLETRWFKDSRKIGIASGASTPDWVIRRVVDKIKKKK